MLGSMQNFSFRVHTLNLYEKCEIAKCSCYQPYSLQSYLPSVALSERTIVQWQYVVQGN